MGILILLGCVSKVSVAFLLVSSFCSVSECLFFMCLFKFDFFEKFLPQVSQVSLICSCTDLTCCCKFSFLLVAYTHFSQLNCLTSPCLSLLWFDKLIFTG